VYHFVCVCMGNALYMNLENYMEELIYDEPTINYVFHKIFPSFLWIMRGRNNLVAGLWTTGKYFFLDMFINKPVAMSFQ
jgi:hypothetical protein